MAVYKQKNSDKWWYKFSWNGQLIRKSTKQTNKRVAETMEAAHKTALAKGEVGIREKKPVPTLKAFATQDFLPFVEAQFQEKPKTLEYYRNGINNLLANARLANLRLDALTGDVVGQYVARRRTEGLQDSSINRELEVLRRMLRLAVEWGKTERAPLRISMLPGEKRRELVLSEEELNDYLKAATELGQAIEADYQKALNGIRATKRNQQPQKPDAFLLREVVTILIDCGLRPDECFRLRWTEVREGSLYISQGKTENARRVIPLSPRAAATIEMRRTRATQEWVFPASTKCGHIEKSTLRKLHTKACKAAGIEPFPLYTFRHTCLTRWATTMDPYTLAYLAGHSDFSTTRRYVHPQKETVLDAMKRAQSEKGGHSFGHSSENAAKESSAPDALSSNDFNDLVGRGEWIRTTDLLVPKHQPTHYQ